MGSARNLSIDAMLSGYVRIFVQTGKAISGDCSYECSAFIRNSTYTRFSWTIWRNSTSHGFACLPRGEKAEQSADVPLADAPGRGNRKAGRIPFTEGSRSYVG